MSQPISQSPFRLDSASGLSARINRNGSLYRLDYKDIILNLFPGNELEGGPANIYLRRLGATTDFIPLLGPESPSAFSANAQGFSASGVWRDIRYSVTLKLAESAPAWFWHVTLENAGTETIQVDLIHVQDLAVAAYG
ncbi:MAG: hypothetical protein RL661_1668, partial [Pseudomonadota bacterium]